tara:strand:+ start:82 stop:1134 length:1053 start_codon:yes stop_codon:yes gene_type:complete
MNVVSLFSSAGIGESFLKESGYDVLVANELLPDRAELYKKLYPETDMIVGNILDDSIYRKILSKVENGLDILIATPPCQAMSVAGKNRKLEEMYNDKRNYLILKVIDFISKKKPNFVLIENVPFLLKLIIKYDNENYEILDLLENIFGNEYKIESTICDTSDFGIPQTRKRAIIKMNKKNKKWKWPEKEKKITVKEAIGHLPSLESGEKSKIKWHYARKHTDEHVLAMKHTPTGKSAFENKKFYPKRKNGEKVKAYGSTYRRIKWNEPAPTITIRNDAISSQRNVHPGKKRKNGEYSDARVLTPLEIMILSSLPEDWNVPSDTPELLLRRCIGESIPPLLTKKIISCIGK